MDGSLGVSGDVWLWLGCGGIGGRVEVISDCGLCVSDLGGLGLSERCVLIECHGLKGEELIKIGASWRWWFKCSGLGVGR